jgi:hypothetical protein
MLMIANMVTEKTTKTVMPMMPFHDFSTVRITWPGAEPSRLGAGRCRLRSGSRCTADLEDGLVLVEHAQRRRDPAEPREPGSYAPTSVSHTTLTRPCV